MNLALSVRDWRTEAQCSGRSDLFFPSHAERPQARELREHIAAALCSNCSVRTECCDFARGNREYGYWGGESESQRVKAGFALIAPIGVGRIRATQTE
jgi:WhiB family transcriptional regulator, redox-sensing transcriptional regulator